MIYFDNASTTKVDEKVVQIMLEAYKNIWGNPSSLHKLGFVAEKKIKESRKIIAAILSTNEKNIFFVPGGTLANNAVLNNFDIKGKNIVISEIEHTSIFEKCKKIMNAEVRYVKVDKSGYIDIENLLSKIDENTVLVSIIHVNNEIGIINDINFIAKKVKEKNGGILFHSDGIQAFKKIGISLNNIDFYTISGHKINGPKGIAALYIKNISNFKPLYSGGPQEKGFFSGTENVQGIIGFAEAAKLDNNYDEIKKINGYLRRELLKIDNVKIISPEENCSPYILNVCFLGIGSEILLHYLEMEDIFISTGSACNKNEKSRVISAIGLDKKFNNGCIRISLSKDSKMEEAEVFIIKLKEKLEIIRGIIR